MVPNGPYWPKWTIWSKTDQIWVQTDQKILLYWLDLLWAHFWTEMEQKCSTMDQTWSQTNPMVQNGPYGPKRTRYRPKQTGNRRKSFFTGLIFRDRISKEKWNRNAARWTKHGPKGSHGQKWTIGPKWTRYRPKRIGNWGDPFYTGLLFCEHIFEQKWNRNAARWTRHGPKETIWSKAGKILT